MFVLIEVCCKDRPIASATLMNLLVKSVSRIGSGLLGVLRGSCISIMGGEEMLLMLKKIMYLRVEIFRPHSGFHHHTITPYGNTKDLCQSPGTSKTSLKWKRVPIQYCISKFQVQLCGAAGPTS